MLGNVKHSIQPTSFSSYQPINGLLPLVMNFLVPDSELFVTERESVDSDIATRRSNTDDFTIPVKEGCILFHANAKVIPIYDLYVG